MRASNKTDYDTLENIIRLLSSKHLCLVQSYVLCPQWALRHLHLKLMLGLMHLGRGIQSLLLLLLLRFALLGQGAAQRAEGI